MAVQQEIKSQLAKLLATEDIVVEHKSCETAQYNVHTRVLTLPLWEKASNEVYDMLVGHEVGHALYTPDEWDWQDEIPHQFMNVVEDARIEKLIKRKYMGLAKTFYRAYNELQKKDFFQLDGEDVDNFNLADRANLHYKVGSFLDIPFSDAEKEIIDLIGKCETFADTKRVAKVLYEYCKEEQKKEHLHKLKTFLEKQKIFFFRISLSDDKEAIEMKDRLMDAAKMFGVQSEINTMDAFFAKLDSTIKQLEATIDN